MKTNIFVKTKLSKIFFTILGIVCLLTIWEILALIKDSTLLPKPIIVFKTLILMLLDKTLWQAIFVTIVKLFIALVVSFLLGLVLGLVSFFSSEFQYFIAPFISVLKTFPTAAIIIILIILVSRNSASLIVTILVSFPILYDSTLAGLKSISKDIIEAANIDGSNKTNSITKVFLPLSSPYIFLGLISTIGLGMKVTIMAEILAGNDSFKGLGSLIFDYRLTVEMDKILAVSIIAILLIGLTDIALSFWKNRNKNVN